MSGYIRGNTLSKNSYVHLTGFGDYLVSEIRINEDPCPVGGSHRNQNSSSSMGIEKDNINSLIIKNKNVDKNEDTVEASYTGGNQTQPKIIDNLDKELKISKEGKKQLDKEIDQLEDLIDFDIKEEEGDDISINDEEIKEANIIEEKESNKHLLKTSVTFRTKDEMEFEDEVDTPIGISCRERFKKYK